MQVTCEAKRKNAHATQSETAGVHALRMRTDERTWRPAHATAAPPITIRSSESSNDAAVGMPSAPSSLT